MLLWQQSEWIDPTATATESLLPNPSLRLTRLAARSRGYASYSQRHNPVVPDITQPPTSPFFTTQTAPTLSYVFATITADSLPTDTSALQIAALDSRETSSDGYLCHLAKTEAYEGLTAVSSYAQTTAADGTVTVSECPPPSVAHIDWLFKPPF